LALLLVLPAAAAGASPGGLLAFGYNFDGELGSATNNGTPNPNPTPTLVGLPGQNGTVTQIAAGANHSLALTSSGQLYAFGYNFSGELGVATNSGTPTPTPTPTLVALPGQIGAVTQIAAGTTHSLVLTSSGELYAFGDNRYGELGVATNNGTNNANPTPTLVGLPGQIGAVTQIAAGTTDSLVLTSSDQLYAFGRNIYGELGSATNNGTNNANPTPTLVGLPGEIGTVTEISAGGTHSLVLTSSGQLYSFGRNTFGELGSATNNGTFNPNPTPTLVALPGQIGTVSQIAAAGNHSLVVTSSGQLYGLGYNYYGELGSAVNNGTANPNPTPTLVMLAAGTTIDTVAKGPSADDTLAIVSGLAITSGSLAAARVGSGYSAGLSAAGGTAPLTWSATGLPSGLSIAAKSGVISGTPNVAGSFSVTITVTDSYGSQASHAFKLAIAAQCPPGQTGTPTGCKQRPALTNVSESHRSWHETKHKPIGTTFSFTLNQPATVSLAFTQRVRGRKIKHRCLAQTRKNRHQPRCTRTVSVGRLSITAHAGANKLFFKGRISHSKKLSPGRYTLVIIARTSNKSSTPKKLSFTIVAS
jgi:hypothetical protein